MIRGTPIRLTCCENSELTVSECMQQCCYHIDKKIVTFKLCSNLPLGSVNPCDALPKACAFKEVSFLNLSDESDSKLFQLLALDFGRFFVLFFESSSTLGLIANFTQFIDIICVRFTLNVNYSSLNIVGSKLIELLRDCYDCMNISKSDGKDDSWVHTTLQWLQTFASDLFSVENHSKLKKILKLFTYVIITPCLWFLGVSRSDNLFASFYESFFSQVIKSDDKSLDLLQFASNALLYFVDAGINFFTGSGFQSDLVAHPEFSNWVERADFLISNKEFVTVKAGSGKLLKSNYMRELDFIIESGDSTRQVISKSRNYSSITIMYTRRIERLKVIRSGMTSISRILSESTQPLGILLYGPSSIGKSHLVDIIVAQFAKYKGFDSIVDSTYYFNDMLKHHDGLKNQHEICVMDDVASTNPKVKIDDSLAQAILMFLNDTPNLSNQAAIEDKAVVYTNFSLVLATTNNKGLNAHVISLAPEALLRRFPIVLDITVKPEFADDSSPTMLDPEKVFAWEKEHLLKAHVHNIIMEKPILDKFGKTDYIKIGEFDNYVDLLQALVIKFEIQEDRSQGVLKRRIKLEEEQLCTCGLLSTYCNCYAGLSDLMMPEACSAYDDYPISITAIILANLIAFLYMFIYPRYLFIRKQISLLIILYKLTRYPVKCYYRFLNWRNLAVVSANMDGRCKPDTVYLKQAWDNAMSQDYLTAQRLTQLKQAGVILGALGSMAALYKLFNRDLPKASSTARYDFSKSYTKAKDNFNANKWKKLPCDHTFKPELVDRPIIPIKEWDPHLNRFNNLEASHPGRQMNLRKIKNRVSSCMGQVKSLVESNDQISTCRNNAIMIGGNMILTVAHQFSNHAKDDTIIVEFVPWSEQAHLSELYTSIIPYNMIYFHPHKDLCLFTMLPLPASKSIINLFSDCDSIGPFDSSWILRERETHQVAYPIESFKYLDRDETLHGDGAMCTIPDILDGDCSSVLYRHDATSSYAYGLLVSYIKSESVAFYQRVLRSDLKLLISGLSKITIMPVTTAGIVDINTLGPAHPKSRFRYMDKAYGIYHGSLPGFRNTPKASVRRTIISDEAQKLFGKTDHHIPHVKRGYHDGIWCDPTFISMRGRFAPSHPVDEGLVKLAFDGFLHDVLFKLKSNNLGVLSNEDSLNGIPAMEFINGVPRSTSAGFNLPGAKMNYCEYIDLDQDERIRLMPEIQHEFDFVEQRLLAGQCVAAIFNMHMKTEEPISTKNKNRNKIRTYLGGPLIINLLLRKYFLSLLRYASIFRSDWETAVGINVHSLEWSEIANRLKDRKHFFDGDFGEFDTTESRLFITFAFALLITVARLSKKYTDQHIIAMQGLAQAIIYHYINYDGDLVQPTRGNPSGHSLTTLINGIVHCLVMRCCYILCGYNVFKFQDNVTLYTFGDDGILGMSDEIPNFNFLTVKKCMGTLGFRYTTAQKGDVEAPYLSFHKLSFLKRKFVEIDDKTYLAPLEPLSMVKSLCFINTKSGLCDKAHAYTVLNGVLFESFHYGELYYNINRNKVEQLLDQFDLRLYSTAPLWSYESLKDRFFN